MNFFKVSECNVCGSENVTPFFYLPQFPLVLRPLPREIKSHLISKNIPSTMPLNYGICYECGHIILLTRLTDEVLQDLYEDLYDTYPAKLKLGYATVYVDEFFNMFGQHLKPILPSGSRILEIGCYDGYLLSKLAQDGFEVAGCDPSSGAEIGQERGIQIIRDFYSPDLFPSNHFNTVIHRHVIEHIDRPVDFLMSIREVVQESGYLFIETPNGSYYLEHALHNPFHSEHLSVFTPASLAHCIEKSGFRVEQIFSDTMNLRAICSLGATAEVAGRKIQPDIDSIITQTEIFEHKLRTYMSELEALVEKISQNGATFALWGAGSYGNITLSLNQTLAENTVAIVDRDSKKHGLSFFNLDIEVKPPEYLVNQPADYIIISSQFGSEIIRDIREKYELDSKIILLTPKIEVVE